MLNFEEQRFILSTGTDRGAESQGSREKAVRKLMVSSGQEPAGPSVCPATVILCELEKFLWLSWVSSKNLVPIRSGILPREFPPGVLLQER